MVGPSYLMRDEAQTDEGLEKIWQLDLLPLLDEHYYGRLTRSEVRERFGLEALRRSLKLKGSNALTVVLVTLDGERLALVVEPL